MPKFSLKKIFYAFIASCFFVLSIGCLGTEKKIKKSSYKQHSPLKYTKKLEFPISTRIDLADKTQIEPQKPFTLSVTLSTNAPTSSLKGEWILPPNIKLLQGSLSQNIPSFKNTYQITATFETSSSDPQQKIMYKVTDPSTGSGTGTSYHLFSENSLRQEKRQIYKRSQENIKNFSKKHLKKVQ
ncbi:MAG: hypothetical protein D6797_07950 [Bdellovibrio sp.]|nr:MAG: hypothetical protein D6797_07950 [Bdellovibrio sp.]